MVDIFSDVLWPYLWICRLGMICKKKQMTFIGRFMPAEVRRLGVRKLAVTKITQLNKVRQIQ